jgi:predicted RNA-binding Zn ribbon-like protein
MDREARLDASLQPGDRPPAPGELALVQAFVNTVDREWGPDLLDDRDGLREWLARRELLATGTDVSERDLQAAVELREALRGLLLANNGGPADPAAAAVLERAADRAALSVRLGGDGPRLESRGSDLAAALGTVVAAAFAAMLDGSWPRLKACPRSVCRWAFLRPLAESLGDLVRDGDLRRPHQGEGLLPPPPRRLSRPSPN